jgi:MFS transporter, putative metabolite:H+ symporter
MTMITANAGPRLDRLPISAFHYRVLLIIGAGMFLDIFELTLASGVLGAVVREGWSDLAHNARFISVTFLGMVIGAWSAGIFGDRYGRKACYQVNLLLFAIPSFAAVFAPSMDWLIAARFFMGLGMGAEIVVGFATLSEFVPPLQRGRWGAGLSAIMNSAVFVAALAGYLIIPNFGWRWMFGAVGVCALLVWVLRQALPESPRWLESKGMTVQAQQVLASIEKEVSRNGPLPEPVRSIPVVSHHLPLRILFSGPLLRRTLVGAILVIALNVLAFGFIAWLPTFFVKQGFTVSASLGFNTLVSLGGPIGALIGLWISGRMRRKTSIVTFFSFATLLTAIYPIVTNVYAMLGVGFALITCVYALSSLCIASYVPELFPTEIRMRGSGFCNTAGRAMVIPLQFVVVPLYESTGITGVMAMLVVFLVCATIAVARFGEETGNRSLEELNPLIADEQQPVRAVGRPTIVDLPVADIQH